MQIIDLWRAIIPDCAGGAWDLISIRSIRSFTDREKQTGMLTHSHATRSVAGEGRWRVEDRLPIQSVNSSMPIELSAVTGHIQFGHLKGDKNLILIR